MFRFALLSSDTYSIVKRLVPEGKTYCSVCSRLRRGILYNIAVEEGCNKIALGHHADDIITTLLLNLFYVGSLKAMPPKLRSNDGRNTVIRPLAYCSENDIASMPRSASFRSFRVTSADRKANLKRVRIKNLISELEKEIPHIRASMLNAARQRRPIASAGPRALRLQIARHRNRRHRSRTRSRRSATQTVISDQHS